MGCLGNYQRTTTLIVFIMGMVLVPGYEQRCYRLLTLIYDILKNHGTNRQTACFLGIYFSNMMNMFIKS